MVSGIHKAAFSRAYEWRKWEKDVEMAANVARKTNSKLNRLLWLACRDSSTQE
jgi:hypothetical protein